MKIVGGNFGTSGSAYVSKDGYLVIDGVSVVNFKPEDVLNVDTKVNKEKRISIISVFFGIVVTIVLFFLFHVIGLFIGLLLTFFGSKHTSENHYADVVFSDNRKVTLECTPRAINKLIGFKG